LLYWQNKTIFLLLVIIIFVFFITPIIYGVYDNIAMAPAEHNLLSGSNKVSFSWQQNT